MKGYPVIDADGHVFETIAIDWEHAVAEPYRHIAPKPAGTRHLVIEGELWPLLFPSDDKQTASDPILAHKSREGMWDPTLRLQHLDLDGIDVAVLFGGGIMCGMSAIRNPGLGNEMARVYNEWLATFCKANPTRLKGVAAVALQEPEAGMRELERAVKKLGFVGAAIPTNVRGKGLDNPFFFPLYETCESLDAPVCIGHGVGVVPGLPSLGQERITDKYVMFVTNFSLELMLGIALVISGGVMDRYPKLRFAFLEGWVSWLPFWMERLDEYVESYASHADMKARPSEYIKGPQFYIGCEPGEEALARVVEAVGEDRILYASDYWHFDAKFPGSVKTIVEKPGLSPAAKRKLLYENASRLYKVTVNGA